MLLKVRVSTYQLLFILLVLGIGLGGCSMTAPVSEMKVFEVEDQYPAPAVVQLLQADDRWEYIKGKKDHYQVLSTTYSPSYPAISTYLDRKFVPSQAGGYAIQSNTQNITATTNLLLHDWTDGAVNVQFGVGSGINMTQRLWGRNYLTANAAFLEGEVIVQRRMFPEDNAANATIGIFVRSDRYKVLEESSGYKLFQLILLSFGGEYLLDYPTRYYYLHQAGIRSSFHLNKSMFGFIGLGKAQGVKTPILNVGITLRKNN